MTGIRPGISQDNRTNMFFMILRRFSDEERNEMKELVSHFLTMQIIAICVSAIPAVNRLGVPYLNFVTLIPILLAVSTTILQSIELRNLISANSYSKVDSMLYGNDYSAAKINNEMVINMIGTCNQSIGRVREFRRTLDQFIQTEIGLSIIMMLIIIVYQTNLS